MDDAELRRLIEQSGEETLSHFDVVAEGLDRKIETVAEAVVNLDQKVDRKFEEVAQQFSDLRQRVDRLESSSTH